MPTHRSKCRSRCLRLPSESIGLKASHKSLSEGRAPRPQPPSTSTVALNTRKIAAAAGTATTDDGGDAVLSPPSLPPPSPVSSGRCPIPSELSLASSLLLPREGFRLGEEEEEAAEADRLGVGFLAWSCPTPLWSSPSSPPPTSPTPLPRPTAPPSALCGSRSRSATLLKSASVSTWKRDTLRWKRRKALLCIASKDREDIAAGFGPGRLADAAWLPRFLPPPALATRAARATSRCILRRRARSTANDAWFWVSRGKYRNWRVDYVTALEKPCMVTRKR